jgi:hypothetical protein
LIYFISKLKQGYWYGVEETALENAVVARIVNLLVANDDGAVG